MTDAAQRWVVLDLGETLVDETENWGRWADHLAVPRLTFFAALGAVIAARRPHTDVFELFRPGFRLEEEAPRKAAAGLPWGFSQDDLYPDALPALRDLRAAGFRLAVMANQPAEAMAFLQTLPVDRVATSAGWGVAKPDPAFFARVASEVGTRAGAHRIRRRPRGQRRAAGPRGRDAAVHLRRGPWGVIHADWPEAAQAHVRLTSLGTITVALEGWP